MAKVGFKNFFNGLPDTIQHVRRREQSGLKSRQGALALGDGAEHTYAGSRTRNNNRNVRIPVVVSVYRAKLGSSTKEQNRNECGSRDPNVSSSPTSKYESQSHALSSLPSHPQISTIRSQLSVIRDTRQPILLVYSHFLHSRGSRAHHSAPQEPCLATGAVQGSKFAFASMLTMVPMGIRHKSGEIAREAVSFGTCSPVSRTGSFRVMASRATQPPYLC